MYFCSTCGSFCWTQAMFFLGTIQMHNKGYYHCWKDLMSKFRDNGWIQYADWEKKGRIRQLRIINSRHIKLNLLSCSSKKISKYLCVYLMYVLSIHYLHHIAIPHPYKPQFTLRGKYFLLFKRSSHLYLVILFNLPVKEQEWLKRKSCLYIASTLFT